LWFEREGFRILSTHKTGTKSLFSFISGLIGRKSQSVPAIGEKAVSRAVETSGAQIKDNQNPKRGLPMTKSSKPKEQATFEKLYTEAEAFLTRKVMPRVSLEPVKGHGGEKAPDPVIVARKCYLDMHDTFYPATVLSGIVLSLRDADKPFAALDPTGDFPQDGLIRLLADDVMGAQARAKLACSLPGLDHATKTHLGAEITASGQILASLCDALGVAPPKNDVQRRIDALRQQRSNHNQIG
jgi:hypothetical protein